MTDTTAGSAQRIAGGSCNTDDGLGENYAALAVAIIERAIKDYDIVLEQLYVEHDPGRRIQLFTMKVDVETFFHSGWYETLTELDPNYLLKRTREIAKRSIKQKIRRRHLQEMAARNGGQLI